MWALLHLIYTKIAHLLQEPLLHSLIKVIRYGIKRLIHDPVEVMPTIKLILFRNTVRNAHSGLLLASLGTLVIWFSNGSGELASRVGKGSVARSTLFEGT